MSEPRMTNNQDDWMSLALKREAEIERLRAALKRIRKNIGNDALKSDLDDIARRALEARKE